jgi:hypothetical protein
MENFKAIELHQVRDFSRKMSATFEFLKQNFLPLGKSLVLIAGPAIFLSTFFAGDFYAGMATSGVGNPAYMTEWVTSSGFWLQMLGIFAFTILAGVFIVSVINNYVKLYDEKKSNQIEVSEVWVRVRQTFFNYLGTTILCFLVLFVAYLAAIFLGILFAAAGQVMTVIAVILFMCGFFYLAFTLALVFPIRSFERINFFSALGRAFYLVNGKWWSTFGVIFITWLISYVMALVFLLPTYIIQGIREIHTTDFTSFDAPVSSGMRFTYQILYSLSFVVNFLGQSLPLLAAMFQYFNLVERKEARGLMSRIETFGDEPAPASEQHDEHY